MDVIQCGSLLSKVRYPSVAGYSLSLSIAFKQLGFFAFLSRVSPNKLLPISLRGLSLAQPLSLSPHSLQALFPSLSHCSYLSLSSQGEPGPKGDPGEKSHWVSSSPALPSRCPPALDAQEIIRGWGQPTQIPFATWSPRAEPCQFSAPAPSPQPAPPQWAGPASSADLPSLSSALFLSSLRGLCRPG